MPSPNRRYNPSQSPPIFDRRQMTPYSPGGGAGGGGGRPFPGTAVPIPPYHGYGMGGMFQNLGKRYDVGSSIPTGGFGFDQTQKAALAPLLQQLPGLIDQPGRHQGVMGPHGGLDMSGGILGALRSLGVDTGDMQGLGIGGDQRQQFLHSLQDFVTGIANRPPNRRPFPGRESPRFPPHGRSPEEPPYAYSPGYRPRY